MKIIKSTSPYLTDIILNTKKHFKIAGLDIGTKHIGVAISDETRQFVFPSKIRLKRNITYGKLSSYDIKSFSKDLNQLVINDQIRFFVIGLPVYNKIMTPLAHDIVELCIHTKISDTLTYKGDDILCTFHDEYESTVNARALTHRVSNKRSVMVKQKDGMY